MEVLREATNARAIPRATKVSILVLMEVLREEPPVRRVLRVMCCFNPCFDGSVERGKIETRELKKENDVSILVLMEVLREE